MRPLLVFKPHYTETQPAWKNAPLRSWRWVLGTRWAGGPYLGLEEEVLGLMPDGAWRPATRYICVWISRHFRLGGYHTYYDGPHCEFSIGWIHIGWSWNWCTKCYNGR